MVYQRFKQLVSVLCALLLLALISSAFYESGDHSTTALDISFLNDGGDNAAAEASLTEITDGVEQEQPHRAEVIGITHDGEHASKYDTTVTGEDSDETIQYREIFSASTWDRKFVPIFYQGVNVINPNIIPHPTEYYQWIIISQREQGPASGDAKEEVACVAVFYEGTLLCVTGAATLPVQPSLQGICQGENADLNSAIGPRNVRVFYGPEAPYVLYSSQSQQGCLGVWIQDARKLVGAFNFQSFVGPQVFLGGTEILRPGSPRPVETDFFLFWDTEGQAYVHHDLFPQRIFGVLDLDGSVSEDLAPLTAALDQICYAKYMPSFMSEQNSVQQATNSLSITLCRRSDDDCILDDSNTFVMHLFHVRKLDNGHPDYESYIMLFQQTAPFAVKAISQRPIWIHGGRGLDNTNGQTERFNINSMNWKSHTQKYHGYIDDMLFLGFGIEDSHPGAMDVKAGDLLQDLAFC